MHLRLVILAGAILTGCIALLARDTTPEQTSNCKGCGALITERTRKPCTVCGSINRHITANAVDTIATADRAE